jgi:hypothetical protein
MPSIRLIGQHHTSHHHGEVLHVAEEIAVINNPATLITLDRAREIVERGDAEWVDPPENADQERMLTHHDEHQLGDHHFIRDPAAPPGERPEEGDDDPHNSNAGEGEGERDEELEL